MASTTLDIALNLLAKANVLLTTRELTTHLTLKQSRILFLLEQCHCTILESIATPKEKHVFRIIEAPAKSASSIRTTASIALRFFGDGGTESDPIYRPRLLEKGVFGVSYKQQGRNVIINSPEFLQALKRSFGNVPVIKSLLELLEVEESIDWHRKSIREVTPSDFKSMLDGQSKRHKMISAHVHYLRAVSVYGTGITKAAPAKALSQSGGGIYPNFDEKQHFYLAAAHHAILAESRDNYPDILEKGLLAHLTKIREMDSKDTEELKKTTTQWILDLVALGISYENALDLFYQTSLDHITPADAIKILKNELLPDFFLAKPREEFKEGSTIPYRSPLYFLNQQTASSPQIINGLDSILEQKIMVFEFSEIVVREEWDSRTLICHLYVLLGQKQIYPEQALDAFCGFFIKLIEHEQQLLDQLVMDQQELEDRIADLFKVSKPMDKEISSVSLFR